MAAEHAQEIDEGDLVWAKLEGHPWWPSVVCASPEGSIRKSNKFGEQTYVRFFSNPPTNAWVKNKKIEVFTGQDNVLCKKGGKFYSSKKTFQSALRQAHREMFKTKEERLKSRGTTKHRRPKSQVATKSSNNKHAGVSTDDDATSAGTVTKAKTRKYMSLSSSVKNRTFNVNNDSIPLTWTTPFVLMNTADVPEDLTPGQFIVVNGKEPKMEIKQEPLDIDDDNDDLDDDDDDVNDVDTEDELVDSDDDDPVWAPGSDRNPGMERATKKKVDCYQPNNDDNDFVKEDVIDDDEDDDIGIDDSDEDPGWQPEVSKGEKKMKIFSKKRKQTTSSTEPVAKKQCTENKETSSVSEQTSVTKAKVIAPPNSSSSTAAPSPVRRINSNEITLITDNTPTGPEPEVGDFLLEKLECKNGDIPFLWRYKKGGLIQKFVRKEEKEKVFYENALNFSDWWSCYAHRFQKVEVQVLYKFRQVEKVIITKTPVIDFSEPNVKETENNNGKTTNDRNDLSNRPGTSTEQEQEVTSTTQERAPASLQRTNSDGEFCIGQFVLDKSDQRNVDNFPIWRIESSILLKKFEPCLKKGRLLHKAVKTFRGYKDIEKQYVPIVTRKVFEFPGDDLVEVTEETKPKLEMDSSIAEQLEKIPLLRHFYVYIQVFLSQALEPGFLEEVLNSKDEMYLVPLQEVDKLVKQKCTNVERKIRWTNKVKEAMKKCPFLRRVNKEDNKRKCEAILDSQDDCVEVVFLFGNEYDPDLLTTSDKQLSSQEFKIGETAVKHISRYHQLCHFKFNLFKKCTAKVNLIKDSTPGIEVEDVMDQCLGNKAWVLQNFEDFTKLVDIL